MLKNVSDEEDRKILFELVPHLFYVGDKEFKALFKAAYDEIIPRWIIDTEGLDFGNLTSLRSKIQSELDHTWICPITDSLDINAFVKVVGHKGFSWRPQWNKVSEPGNTAISGLIEYINENNIKRLVLLEDFVGSGSQIACDVNFVCNKTTDLKILLIPLINCPKGVEYFSHLELKQPQLTASSVISLSKKSFVLKDPIKDEPELFNEIRKLIYKVHSLVSDGRNDGTVYENYPPYSPLGYRETGGLVVMSKNTPDNSLPIIHWPTSQWNPLFTRHDRET
jgi:CxxC motif-containing protein